MRKIIALFCLIATANIIYAQDSITTNHKEVFHFASTRPSFSEGVLLVPKGKAQVEIGSSYAYFNAAETHIITHPTFHLKYGISKYFEFRINGDAITYKAPYYRVSGLKPIYIGMKLKMLDAKKYAPGSSFIGGLSASFISTKNLRPKYVAPYFRILMEQFLPKNVGMVYNYGLVWNGEDAKPTYNFAVATSYTKVLQNTNEKHHQFKYFFEAYLIYPHGEKFDARLNTGFSYLFNKYLQADISVGAGLLKYSPRVITSAGLVARFPNKTKKETKEED